MMPIDFCASFEPCENAMAHGRDELHAARAAVHRGGPHPAARSRARPIIRRNATTKPRRGERTSGTQDLVDQRVPLEGAEPRRGRPPRPPRPPTRACEELEGMPRHHVKRFQTLAPTSAREDDGLA